MYTSWWKMEEWGKCMVGVFLCMCDSGDSYSTLHHLLPIGRCWEVTLDCCDFSTGSQMHALITRSRIHLNHCMSVRFHPPYKITKSLVVAYISTTMSVRFHPPYKITCPEIEITKNKNLLPRLWIFYRLYAYPRMWFSVWKSQTFGKSLQTFGSQNFLIESFKMV